eukprot:5102790-Pyramimonas_sp.AAC.1
MSLHCDGVMVNRSLATAARGSVEAFCADAAVNIAEQTGFAAEIAEKQHFYFLELLEQSATGRRAISHGGEHRAFPDADGHRTHAAVHYLGASAVNVPNALVTQSPWNETAESSGA